MQQQWAIDAAEFFRAMPGARRLRGGRTAPAHGALGPLHNSWETFRCPKSGMTTATNPLGIPKGASPLAAGGASYDRSGSGFALRSRGHAGQAPRRQGFTLLEILVVLVLLGLLGLFGLEAVRGIIAQYQFARSADAVTQKAQIALQRISVELGYVKATNLDVSGTTVTNGAAPAIGYTANLPAGDETHGIFQSGTSLYYGDATLSADNAFLLTDDVAVNGITFRFYDTYGATASVPSAATTLIAVSLTMHGSGWPSSVTKTFSTRVLLNKPNQ